MFVGVLAAQVTACSGSGSGDGFCESARHILKGAVEDVTKGDDAFDETGFVANLRAIDLTELRPADKEAFTVAIGEVESALFASRGGWTTQPVATVAARLCPQEMPVISVVP